MTTLLLDHLWQSTWFALAIALLAWSLRKNGAHVRYWLWLTASAKFLVPFSMLTFAGHQLGSGDIPTRGFERLNRIVEMTVAPASARDGSGVQPLALPGGQAAPSVPAVEVQNPSADAPRSRYALFVRAFTLVWLGGSCVVLLMWLARWVQVRRLVRSAIAVHSRAALDMPIPVLESSSRIEPGVAGIICQYYAAPPRHSAAISGGDLRQRIQRITAGLAPDDLGMEAKFALTTLAIAIVATPVLFGAAMAASEAGGSREADHSTLAQLYEAAKQEGEVVVMAVDPRDANWIPAAFAKSFPGIQIRVSTSLGHLPLIINDAESFRPGLDLVMTSLMEAHALDENSLLANMDWTPFRLQANHIGLDGRFAYTNNFVYTVSYDERRVGKQGIPVSWRDLLGPQYRGAMSTNAYIMPRLMAGLALTWGEAEAESFGRQLRDQNVLNQFGDAKGYFLNESNQRRYFIGMPNTVTEQWEKQGLPSGYVVPEPVIMEQQGTAVLVTAPHPAAARLLAGWLATEEAKAIRSREGQSTDLLPDSSDPMAVTLRARQVPIVYDTPETTGKRVRLAENFQPIFSTDPNYNPYRRLPAFGMQLLPGLLK